MAPGSRYHVLPRDSMDSDREDPSAHEFLLPSPTINTNLLKFSISCSNSPSLYPALVLRFVSFVLGLTAFILLVTRGGHRVIAVDVFLMMTVVFNTLKLLGTLISSQKYLSIRIQIRDMKFSTDGWRRRKASFTRPGISSYIDLGLAMALSIATPTCWRKLDYWDSRQALPGVILSYIVLGFQIILAIPMFDRLYFTAHIKQTEEANMGSFMAHRPDLKQPVLAESSSIPEPQVTRSRSEHPAPTQVAEDLV